MDAVIVVESVFGTTRPAADAVAACLSAVLSARIMDVAEASTAIGSEVDLLAVGAPTHFGLTGPG